MKIFHFVHKEKSGKNRKLFSLIGEFCASNKVRDDLSGNLSSEPGRVWLVGLKKKGVSGFASLKFQRSAVFLKHLYGLDATAEPLLLESAIANAREMGGKRLVTTDYVTRKDFYTAFGFKAGRERGRFIRLEMAL